MSSVAWPVITCCTWFVLLVVFSPCILQASGSTAPGGACNQSSDCSSVQCLGNRCCQAWASAWTNCESCNSNGNCGQCIAGHTWVNGVGCAPTTTTALTTVTAPEQVTSTVTTITTIQATAPGGACSDNSDCSSQQCLGNRCCQAWASAWTNCESCNSNGNCLQCIAGHTWVAGVGCAATTTTTLTTVNVTVNEISSTVQMPAALKEGEHCSKNSDCISSRCLGGYCCSSYALIGNCSKCNSQGFCGGCDPGFSWTGGVGCANCPAGRYAAPSKSCMECQLGRYALKGFPSCEYCKAGQEPTPKLDGCQDCQPGTFAQLGHPFCSRCMPGEVSSNGSSMCKACEPGTYSNKVQSECLSCEAGTFAARYASLSCSACPIGEVSSRGSQACTPCEAGRYFAFETLRCVPCAAGEFSPEPGKTACMPCSFWSQSEEGSSKCHDWWPAFVAWLSAGVASMIAIVALCMAWRVLSKSVIRALEADVHRLASSVVEEDWRELYVMKEKYSQRKLHRAKLAVIERGLEDLKQRSTQLGINMEFILNTFPLEVHERLATLAWRQDADSWIMCWDAFNKKYKNESQKQWDCSEPVEPPQNPTFLQMAPVVSYGDLAYGYGHLCPRDGIIGSSIVDAVHGKGMSGKASHYLSWVWAYDLDMVLSALGHWKEEMLRRVPNFDPSTVMLWWCFFNNNQNRLLQATQAATPEELAATFGKKLDITGKMLVIMNNVANSSYIQRIWCVYELFVATKGEIPVTICLPKPALSTLHNLKTITELMEVTVVSAEHAKATVQEDEDMIKNLILSSTGSFRYVNDTVQRALWSEIMLSIQMLNELPHDPSCLTNEWDQCTGPMLAPIHFPTVAWKKA